MGKIGRIRSNKKVASEQGKRNDLHGVAMDIDDITTPPITRMQPSVNYQEDGVLDVDGDGVAPAVDVKRAQRIMVAVMFEKDYTIIDKFTIQSIRKRARLGPRFNVKLILEDYCWHRHLGITYKGDRHLQDETKLGRKAILSIKSVEAQLVADALEDGVSLRHTHLMVNAHRMEEELPSVTFAAVYSLVKRLKPKVQKVHIHRQGDCDVDSPWARARLGFATQLLIRYGVIDFDCHPNDRPSGFDSLAGYYDKTKPIPTYFDKTKLTPLDPHGQADWDEAHRQCCPGEGLGNPKKLTRLVFPRDKDGKLDFKSGSYTEEKVTMMRVKYNDEMRKAFGVAMVKPIDSNGNYLLDDAGKQVVEGRRLPDFDYTGKTIKSIKEYTYLLNREIHRVKNLTGNGGGWVVKNRIEGKIYVDDALEAVPGIGAKTADRMRETGVASVHDLLELTDDAVVEVALRVNGMSAARLRTIIGQVLGNIVLENAPADVDYRMHSNPYSARYGDDWKKEIAKTAAMNQYVCVKTMVEHIVVETRKVFQDTKFATDFHFYHDALSLMTDKECVEWMRQQDYLKHWILPEAGLFHDDDDLKRYRHRPVGNSPELNALDNSLNKDVHEAVNRHVDATLMVQERESKFSIRTPKEAAWTYTTLWNDIVPTSKRIIQDRTNIINSLKWIIKMKGAVVRDDDLRRDFDTGVPLKEMSAIRNGHRSVTAARAAGPRKRGGARKRKQALDDYGQSNLVMHPTALKVSKVKREVAKSIHGGTNNIEVDGIEFKPSYKAKIEKLTLSSSSPEE